MGLLQKLWKTYGGSRFRGNDGALFSLRTNPASHQFQIFANRLPGFANA